MDQLLQVVTILFILSLVCERVGEFLKNCLSEFSIGNFQLTGDTISKAPPNSIDEQIRHYRILKINLWCGFITAFICHASLFDVLANLDNPSEILGWPDTFSFKDIDVDVSYLPSNIWYIAGCFLTGCFISLGSKFWHDVLDLIVAVKDLKRTNTPSVLGEFDDLSADDQRIILTNAINSEKPKWKRTFKNYRGVTIAKKMLSSTGTDQTLDKLVLRFNVTKRENFTTVETNRIPPTIFFEGYNLPTDVVPTGIGTASNGPIISTSSPREMGSSIGREGVDNTGTLGVRMHKGNGTNREFFGVSCYHVLFPDELKNNIREIKNFTDAAIVNLKHITSPSRRDGQGNFSNVGTVECGKFNSFLDIGFFKTDAAEVSERIHSLGVPAGIRRVTPDDEGILKVKICGRTSGMVEGHLDSVKADPIIRYFKKFDHEFVDVLQIKMSGQEGDSGAAVLTKDTNELIGILVGVDAKFVYAIPAVYIEKNFPFKL